MRGEEEALRCESKVGGRRWEMSERRGGSSKMCFGGGKWKVGGRRGGSCEAEVRSGEWGRGYYYGLYKMTNRDLF